jgi:hypothetical protein
MTKISSPLYLNSKAIASQILAWLEQQHFEVKLSKLEDDYYITARKTNALRVVLIADHALIVGIRRGSSGSSGSSETTGTIIEVKQGPWETKIISNAVWLALTGGTNLLIAGWSFILQKHLENYIESKILTAAEVLDPNYPIPDPHPSMHPTSHLPAKPLTNALESTVSAISKIGKDISRSASKLMSQIKDKPKPLHCTRCGEIRQKDAKFCSNCGENFK